ncbi:MAG: hypothetical protein ACK56F_13935, partial [bacterium]
TIIRAIQQSTTLTRELIPRHLPSLPLSRKESLSRMEKQSSAAISKENSSAKVDSPNATSLLVRRLVLSPLQK